MEQTRVARRSSIEHTASVIVPIKTKYGGDTVSVVSFDGARRLFVLRERLEIAKGRVLPRGTTIPGNSQGGRLTRGVVLEPGTIFFPRWIGEELRHDIYVGGVYDAIRGRFLTLLGYGLGRDFSRDTMEGEAQQIIALKRSVAEFWMLLRQYGQLAVDERETVSMGLAEIAGTLARVRNPEKRIAQRQVSASASVKDRLGRPNQGAARARLVVAMHKFEIRLAEIRCITPRIGGYEIALLNERDRVFEIFREIDLVVRNRVGRRGILRGSKIKIEQSRIGIALRLDRLNSALGTVYAEPFASTCANVRALLQGASSALRNKDIVLAIKKLEDILVLVVFCEIERQFEYVRLEYACAFATEKVTPAFGDKITAFRKSAELLLLDSSDFNRTLSLPEEFRTALGIIRDVVRSGRFAEAKELLTETGSLLFAEHAPLQ